MQFYLLDHGTAIGKGIDIALLGLNLAFVAVFVVDTYPVPARVQDALWSLEIGIAGVFLVEYLLRLYGAEDRPAEFLNAYTMVDLVAILPTLVVVASPLSVAAIEVGFLRSVRVIRVLRFYRFTRDEEFFFGSVSAGTLRAVKLLLTVLVVLFVAAGLFYSAEYRANPGIGNFGDAFYFTVVALATVGFGDITPVTQAGRWITVSAIIAGIIVIPWQASKIVKAWTTDDKVDVTCPNCGLTGHDPDASHCKACGNVIYQEYESE